MLDFVEGGSLHNDDGNRARIRKINPVKKIAMTWEQADTAADTPVEIAFQASAGKTTVMITHDRLQTRGDADGLRAAWGVALGRLKASLEGASS
ncbi:MAG: SRPBCC domain-containing protein [Xanthomonadaceae bacterium]|nr:SRPBCC domain-containing protein [Xanthomonadaceae bacterium]MDP2184945.1 SRPBCC domain-containing protein [Xanthomonadales bacterium]MDZ4115946.1 SRPBCC domain-containing protein [Xanthomonadaceae bacterium]MDZ4378144.1 SRPBCC domain-containing protein [Xanthomonadaceae bacterium]